MSHFLTAVITKKSLQDGGYQELEDLLAPYNESTEDPKYLKFEEDEDGDFDEKLKRHGYWFNPNAKWDWYQVGGRWSNALGTVMRDKISNIDFSVNKDDYKQAARYWEVVVEKSPLRNGEDKSQFESFYNINYYHKMYKNKDAFARTKAMFNPFAVVDMDGKWHEKGEMGWFGMNSADKDSAETFRTWFDEYIKNHQDAYLTIVDCHI